MKKLSIKEKARRYDEALKVLHKYDGVNIMFTQDLKEEMFPELKESDDEKIRKEMIFYFTEEIPQCSIREHADKMKEYIAWLEKQGEQKPVPDWMPNFLDELRSKKNYFDWDEDKDIEGGILAIINWMNPDYFNEKDGEQKPADKVEPKFKVGDWVVFNEHHNSVYQVERIDNYRYYLRHYLGGTLSVHFDNELIRHWTIEDARDGDVLFTSSTASYETFIFKGLTIEGYIKCYCSYDSENKYCEGKYHFIGRPTFMTHPATKEQRDLLFQKMHEAGYMWDSKNKQLLSLEAEPSGKKQNIWSEEDETMLENIKEILTKQGFHQIQANWLKSLKDRVVPQPKQEWSEEDLSMIGRIRSIIEKYAFSQSAVDVNGELCEKEFIDADNWLKSLRPQNRWKPSMAQLNALSIVSKGNAPDDIEVIVSLYNDLKKLMEE